MNDHLLDELIQMDTWDWWKSQLFVLREQSEYAEAEVVPGIQDQLRVLMDGTAVNDTSADQPNHLELRKRCSDDAPVFLQGLRYAD